MARDISLFWYNEWHPVLLEGVINLLNISNLDLSCEIITTFYFWLIGWLQFSIYIWTKQGQYVIKILSCSFDVCNAELGFHDGRPHLHVTFDKNRWLNGYSLYLMVLDNVHLFSVIVGHDLKKKNCVSSRLENTKYVWFVNAYGRE